MEKLFLAIEGQDHVGKATQVTELRNRISEFTLDRQIPEARTIALPQYEEESSCLVRRYLQGEFGDPSLFDPYKASFFYIFDRYAANFKVKEWLNEGRVVIADRWTMSNVAHQSAKLFRREELSCVAVESFINWLMHIEHYVMRIVRPLYIVLKLPAEASKGEGVDGHEINLPYQRKVAYLYSYLAKTGLCGEAKVVDCFNPENREMLPVEVISQKIWKVVEPLLEGEK